MRSKSFRTKNRSDAKKILRILSRKDITTVRFVKVQIGSKKTEPSVYCSFHKASLIFEQQLPLLGVHLPISILSGTLAYRHTGWTFELSSIGSGLEGLLAL